MPFFYNILLGKKETILSIISGILVLCPVRCYPAVSLVVTSTLSNREHSRELARLVLCERPYHQESGHSTSAEAFPC